jgi:hypothetical protein
MNRPWDLKPMDASEQDASAQGVTTSAAAQSSVLPPLHLRLESLSLPREPEAMTLRLSEALRHAMAHPIAPEMQRLVAQAAQRITISLQQALPKGGRP